MGLKAKLVELREFVEAEQKAGLARLLATWEKALHQKLKSGESQRIKALELTEDGDVVAILGEGESRFREGDMVCFHDGEGDVSQTAFIRQASISAEYDGQWLLTGMDLLERVRLYPGGLCYADIDSMDLTPFFHQALDDIATSSIGREIILPMLAGQLNTDFCYPEDFDNAAASAEQQNFNEAQQNAVGYGVASRYISCIQGPPGTGKTKVISMVAKILVAKGQSVLLTSHTHMAINNALNKIHQEKIPVVKIGVLATTKGLDKGIPYFGKADDWTKRPDNGYVIGATPFATCTERLQDYQFDTVIFDEASQITVPLAVMAMRKAKRFVFVGDHKQLPPVVLSQSVLDQHTPSVFSQLIDTTRETSTILTQTYRMNRQLAAWPSKTFYQQKLIAAGPNPQRMFALKHQPERFVDILSAEHSQVFIKSPGVNCKTTNAKEAELVKDIIDQLLECEMSAADIGIVTPFRNHARKLKTILSRHLAKGEAKQIVTDTVERMQGQERELIILSLCATDPVFISNIVSFFFQPERLNVAVTRPKTKLIIIGPEIDGNFRVNNPIFMQWIGWYRSLLDSAYKPLFDKESS